MAARRKSQSRRRQRKESPDGNELLLMELQQIHSAESQLSRVLPRLARAVESERLQQMIEQRQEEGERVLKELENAFDELDESAGRRRNAAAEGLINDVREHTQQLEQGPALDAVLIAGIQKTEHYCIAAWGTARSLGEALGQKATVKAMERAIKEGKSFDEQLTSLAEEEVTPALLAEGSEEDEEEVEEAPRSRRNGGSDRRVST